MTQYQPESSLVEKIKETLNRYPEWIEFVLSDECPDDMPSRQFHLLGAVLGGVVIFLSLAFLIGGGALANLLILSLSLAPLLYTLWKFRTHDHLMTTQNFNTDLLYKALELLTDDSQTERINGLLILARFRRQNLFTDVIDMNTRGMDLREADLKRAQLHRLDLSGVQLQGANLSNANLHKTNLQGANLQRAKLKNANLQRSDLSDANLKDAALRDANLKDAQLNNTTLHIKHKEKVETESPDMMEFVRWIEQESFFDSEAI